MSDALVKRLRIAEINWSTHALKTGDLDAAADEIERLKAENEQIQLAFTYKRFTVEDTVTGKKLTWWGTEARGEDDE